LVRKQTERARQAANKAARSVADKVGEVDFRRIDPRNVELPKIDWERGRLVRKDAAPAIGHNFHAEDVAWPLRLVGWLVNRYIRLCEATTSLLVAGDGPFVQLQVARQPIILLVWHGRNFQGIPMARLFHSPITALTSRSRDGAVIANVIRPFGYQSIQGSGTGKSAGKKTNPRKRGAQAFRGMLKHLKNGEMVLATADVPPGPVFETGPGMVKLAAMSGAAIVPVGVCFSPELPVPGTWDKSRLPLPFGQRSLVFGDPVYIARDVAKKDATSEAASEEGEESPAMMAACELVTQALQQSQKDAEGLLGKKS